MEIADNAPGQERQGAEKIIRALISMILHEIQLAKNVAGEGTWDDIEKDIERAIVMIDSGVGSESIHHMTQALSKVTTIGQNSMMLLQKEGLL
jgi:hypothetical protein